MVRTGKFIPPHDKQLCLNVEHSGGSQSSQNRSIDAPNALATLYSLAGHNYEEILAKLSNFGSSRNLMGPSANNRKLGLYKTELCRSWEEKGSCRYGPKCQFGKCLLLSRIPCSDTTAFLNKAHGREELRNTSRHPKYKTEICKVFLLKGFCPYAKREIISNSYLSSVFDPSTGCCFVHTTRSSDAALFESQGVITDPSNMSAISTRAESRAPHAINDSFPSAVLSPNTSTNAGRFGSGLPSYIHHPVTDILNMSFPSFP